MRLTEFAFSRDRARPCLSRKNTRALHQREVRINFEKLSPYCPRFFRAPEMAVTRCQQHAARVGARIACDAIEQLLGGDLIFSQAEIRLRQEVQHDRAPSVPAENL